jgi:hypothetical protein
MPNSFNHVGSTSLTFRPRPRFPALHGVTQEEPEAAVSEDRWIKRMTRFPDAALRIAWLELDGIALELTQYEISTRDSKTALTTKGAGSAHLAMGLDGLEAEHARLAAKEVEFRSDPITVPHGPRTRVKAVYAVDPDENPVELIETP